MNSQTIPASPFRDIRRELEDPQTDIFVNYKDYADWTANKNCLIKGSRGTGKSSVLTIFDYRTQWLNPSIIQPTDELKVYFPDKPDIIGLLYKCDTTDTTSIWDKWQHTYNETDYATILFSTYIHYYFIAQIIEAITAISEKHKQNCDVPRLISKIMELCYPESQKRYDLYDYSFYNLKSSINNTIHSLRRFIISLAPFDIIEKYICWHTPASTTISDVGIIINESLSLFRDKKYFLLIDDVDRLNEKHLQVLNSMMKVVQNPCSFKLSSTKDCQVMCTLDGVALSNTDLHISNLNDEEESGADIDNTKIDELFNAIFNIRISQYIKELNISNDINVKNLFGKDNIEESLLDVVKNASANSKIKVLYKEWENYQEKNKFENTAIKYFTDYWLFKNNVIKEDNTNRQVIGKYRVSSVFSILHHCNLKGSFNYGSYDLIRFISSGSPRNFLRICDKIWGYIYTALLNDKIPIEKKLQSNAIKKASGNLFENNISKEQFNAEIKVSLNKMTIRLSDIFTKFMTIESLQKSPECLSLQIDISKFSKEDKYKFDLIIDSLFMREAIKLRKDKDNENRVKIALNPMLTPHFCLPYRSPFSYSQTIEPSLLLRLLTESDEKEVNKLKSSIIAKRINNVIPNLF